MPIETASYISQLVPANPASDDALATAQNHLQLLKSVLQAQFPNLGAAAVAAAASDLYEGIGADVQSLKTNAILNTPTAGVTAQGINGNFTATGTVNAATILQGGSPLIPTGVVCMWTGSPTAIPAGWLLCNGQPGTPDLRDRFVVGATLSYTQYSTGGASVQTVSTSSAGAHNHGGADGISGPWGMSGSADIQGSHNHGGGVGGWSLTVDELPAHSHTYGVSVVGVGGGAAAVGVSGSSASYSTSETGSGNPHSHGISTDGAHTHNISVSNVPAHQHAISFDGVHAHTVSVSTMPPYYALCFIMKQ